MEKDMKIKERGLGTWKFAVVAVMATAGLYVDSGKWLYHTGLPARSGVGGKLYPMPWAEIPMPRCQSRSNCATPWSCMRAAPPMTKNKSYSQMASGLAPILMRIACCPADCIGLTTLECSTEARVASGYRTESFKEEQ
jgi:hypothetical protein